jgi:predicted chitinase
MKEWHVDDMEHLVVYALATISAETMHFDPSAEGPSREVVLPDGKKGKGSVAKDNISYLGMSQKGERPFGNYDDARLNEEGTAQRLGNAIYRGKDDVLMRSLHGDAPIQDLNEGERYRGRGFIQLTGRYNYEQMQKGLRRAGYGIDIVNDPDSASDPKTAARILACMIAFNRVHIDNAMAKSHYIAARKILNHAAAGMERFRGVIHRYKHLRRVEEKVRDQYIKNRTLVA